MPALTANADEREALPLRGVGMVKGPVVELGRWLYSNPWGSEFLANFHRGRNQLVTPLRLLFQLQHQLFPLGGERGMLLAQAFEQLG